MIKLYIIKIMIKYLRINYILSKDKIILCYKKVILNKIYVNHLKFQLNNIKYH